MPSSSPPWSNRSGWVLSIIHLLLSNSLLQGRAPCGQRTPRRQNTAARPDRACAYRSARFYSSTSARLPFCSRQARRWADSPLPLHLSNIFLVASTPGSPYCPRLPRRTSGFIVASHTFLPLFSPSPLPRLLFTRL